MAVYYSPIVETMGVEYFSSNLAFIVTMLSLPSSDVVQERQYHVPRP